MVNRNITTEKKMKLMRLEDEFREGFLKYWEKFDEKNGTRTVLNYSMSMEFKKRKRNAS